MMSIILNNVDTTIYESEPLKNTGYDELLELERKTIGLEKRILLKPNPMYSIDVDDIDKIKLRLYVVNDVEFPDRINVIQPTIDVVIAALYQDIGDGGIGKYYDEQTKYAYKGINWYTDFVQDNAQLGYRYTFVNGGCNWYKDTEQFYELKFQTVDIFPRYFDFDITALKEQLFDKGIIILLNSEQEYNNDISIKFYSNETRTILRPRILLYKNNKIYQPATNAIVIDNPNNYIIKGDIPSCFKVDYTKNNVHRIKLSITPLIRKRNYVQNYEKQLYNELTNMLYTFPENTYYNIIDKGTSIYVSDWDNVNVDDTNCYIDIYPAGLLKNRVYDIVLKINNYEYILNQPFNIETYA